MYDNGRYQRSTGRRFSVFNPQEQEEGLPLEGYRDDQLPLEAVQDRYKFKQEMGDSQEPLENQVNSAGYGAQEEAEQDSKNNALMKMLSSLGQGGAEGEGEDKNLPPPSFKNPPTITPETLRNNPNLAKRLMQQQRAKYLNHLKSQGAMPSFGKG